MHLFFVKVGDFMEFDSDCLERKKNEKSQIEVHLTDGWSVSESIPYRT